MTTETHQEVLLKFLNDNWHRLQPEHVKKHSGIEYMKLAFGECAFPDYKYELTFDTWPKIEGFYLYRLKYFGGPDEVVDYIQVGSEKDYEDALIELADDIELNPPNPFLGEEKKDDT